MTIWTFEPPFPGKYFSSGSKKMFIAAEPNGDNLRPGKRDMGEWLRNVPKTGTKFYRYLASVAATFTGADIDPRNEFDGEEVLGEWRFIDLVKEEAGSVVIGDFKKRVQNNATDTLQIILKDKPDVIVLLGGHAQTSFEDVIAPHLMNTGIKRLGLPHPSSRVGGYISRSLIGDPNLMLKCMSERMMLYAYRGGWRSNK